MIDFSKDLAITLLNSTDQYPVDFDDAWEWLGFANKASAKRKLSSLVIGVDYSTEMLKNPSAGRPSESIRLTVEAFKVMGMMAGTEKGREIRLYFLECEKVAKLRGDELDAISEMEMIARTATRLAALQRQSAQQQKQLDQAEIRITAIECEQGRYKSPGGYKYTVLGYAKKEGLEISGATASSKGKAAARLCRDREIVIEQIHDPRFGNVNLYPESILIEVFG